jgi:DNA-binding NtrC family response regulator
MGKKMSWRDKLKPDMVNIVTGVYVDRFLSSGVKIRGGQLVIPVDTELMMVKSDQELGGGGIAFARALSKLTRDNGDNPDIRLLTKIGSEKAPWTEVITDGFDKLEKAGIKVELTKSEENALHPMTQHFVAKETAAGVVMLTEVNVLTSFTWDDIGNCPEELSGILVMFSLMKTKFLKDLPKKLKEKPAVFVVLSPGRIDMTDQTSRHNLEYLYHSLSDVDVLFISYEGLLTLVEQTKRKVPYEIEDLWDTLPSKNRPSILVIDWWDQKLVFEKKEGFICAVSTNPGSDEQGNYCVGINHVWEAAFLLALIQDKERDIKKAAKVAQTTELIVRRNTEQPGGYAPIEDVDFSGLIPYKEEMCEDIKLEEKCPWVLDTRIIGSSEAMRQVKREIIRLAPVKVNVLILGETGTGKELVAHAIHDISPYREGNFRAINCAAIPGELLEAELFGYVKGAFSPADRDTLGVITEAAGYSIKHHNMGKANYSAEYNLTNKPGTVFLDEIAEMPLNLQAKLLRVIEEKKVTPVGYPTDWLKEPLSIDVRFTTATNKDLYKLVQQGKFRADLFYRLSVYNITLPSLQARKDDIPPLIEHFLQECIKEGMYEGDANWPKNPNQKTSKHLEIIIDHDWQGNVRELKNFVQRAAIHGILEEEENTHGVTQHKNVCDVIEKIAESIKQHQEEREQGEEHERGEVSPILHAVTSFVESSREMLELCNGSADKIKEEIIREVKQRFFPTMPGQEELIEAVHTALCHPDFGDWNIGETSPERKRLVRVLAEIYNRGELSNNDYQNMPFIDNARNVSKLINLLRKLLVEEAKQSDTSEQSDIKVKFCIETKKSPLLLQKYRFKSTRYALSEEFRQKVDELRVNFRKKP